MSRNYEQAFDQLCRTDIIQQQEIVLDAFNTSCVDILDDCEISWLEIRGISDFAAKLSPDRYALIMERVLAGQASVQLPPNRPRFLMFRIYGDGKMIHVSLGCDETIFGVLKSTLQASYPGIELMDSDGDLPMRLKCGGVLTGYPSFVTDEKDDPDDMPVDMLLRGIGKKPFCITVTARLENQQQVAWLMSHVLQEQQRTTSDISHQGEVTTGISQTFKNFFAERYQAELEKLTRILVAAQRSSLWSVETFYAAETPETADHLGGLLCATMNGDTSSVLEPMACRRLRYMSGGPYSKMADGILAGCLFLTSGASAGYSINSNPFATYYSAKELARLASPPRKEVSGYYVNQFVEFDVDNRPGARTGEYRLGDIKKCCQYNADSEGDYTIGLDDLTRHLLIIGLTGGGKTNTSKGLLRTLWTKFKIPFLVIESAKREYWELSMLEDDEGKPAFRDMNVFTLGDENPATSSPFRLNPMESIPGVSLQAHIDYLLSTFKAAFDLFPPTPYVLETAVYKVYADRGWDIVTGENKLGLNRYPSLTDLQAAIEEVTDSLGYNDEVRSNVKAALKARIGSLMVGGKNFLMNTPNSLDMEYLLNRPTVLELEDLGDDDTKAFVIGMLLVRIYEHRKAMQNQSENRVGGGKHLQHIIMVEEAHRLLQNVQGGGEGNQSRAKAVEFFCNMLAEIRSYGQGFFIADQVPTKLAPDTLKNTNLKIIHRTVMREDREAVGGAMNMTEDQTSHLSALRVGFGAVFSEGDNRPKLVQFPLITNKFNISRTALVNYCRNRIAQEQKTAFMQGRNQPACAWCSQCCQHGDNIEQLLCDVGGIEQVRNTLMSLGGQVNESTLIDCIDTLCMLYGHTLSREQKLCFAGIILDRLVPDIAIQNKIFRKFIYKLVEKETEV